MTRRKNPLPLQNGSNRDTILLTFASTLRQDGSSSMAASSTL